MHAILAEELLTRNLFKHTSQQWMTRPLPLFIHTDCISNSTILSNYNLLLSTLCTYIQVKKMVFCRWSHSSSEEAMSWCMLSVKCCCFVWKPSCKSHNFWTSLSEVEEEEEERKDFDSLATFWFGTFMMFFHATRRVFGHDNTQRWMVCYQKGF